MSKVLDLIVSLAGDPATKLATSVNSPPSADNSKKLATTDWVTPLAAHGQCRLYVASAAQLTLLPYNGKNLIINGNVQQIPSAGVSISNAGLAAGGRYFVYAYMNGATMALELSTTAHGTHTNGVEVKGSDPSRTLVGMISTDFSSQFADTPTMRFCINWFNRRNIFGSLSAGTLTFGGGGLAEISQAFRLFYISWSDEAVQGTVDGSTANNSAGQATYVQLWLSGNMAGGLVQNNAFGANAANGFSSSTCGVAPENGYFIYQVYGNVSGGTGSLINPQLKMMLRG